MQTPSFSVSPYHRARAENADTTPCSKLEMDYFHKGDSCPNPYQNFKTSTVLICEEVYFQPLVIAILQ